MYYLKSHSIRPYAIQHKFVKTTILSPGRQPFRLDQRRNLESDVERQFPALRTTPGDFI